MNVSLSPRLEQEILKITSKDAKLLVEIQKQLKFFKQNPKHPSLRTHKLSGNLKDSYSISITKSLRMIYTKNPDGSIYFFKLGTHEEVYGR